MRRIVGALAVAVALGLTSCGGTNWNSAHSAKKSANPAKRPNAAAAAAAERPYVDALVVSAHANDRHANEVVTRCAAVAIVHRYGPSAFKTAGLTTTLLRTPTSSLRKLPAPNDADIAALGAAVQKCGVGDAIAGAMGPTLGSADPATASCLARRLDTDAAARRYLVL